MISARRGHTATLLKDGRVVVFGGFDAAGTALSSVEIFEPGFGFTSTTPTGIPPVARGSHSAVLLGKGRILVAFGSDGTSSLDSAAIFDPDAEAWSAAASSSEAHGPGHKTTLLPNGQVLVVGGADVVVDAMELYRPGGSSCTASGTGDISNASVSLAAGGTVIYKATGTVALETPTPLSNTVTVAPPAGVADPNLANNTASVDTTVTEPPGRHCQLSADRARLGWSSAELGFHQAHVTSDQAKKERARSMRWLAGRSRWRPTRKRFKMTPWTDKNRCA
jgi:hypothetical protein